MLGNQRNDRDSWEMNRGNWESFILYIRRIFVYLYCKETFQELSILILIFFFTYFFINLNTVLLQRFLIYISNADFLTLRLPCCQTRNLISQLELGSAKNEAGYDRRAISPYNGQYDWLDIFLHLLQISSSSSTSANCKFTLKKKKKIYSVKNYSISFYVHIYVRREYNTKIDTRWNIEPRE